MIRIRPATEADFAALLQVQREAFGEYATVYEVSAWTTETLDSLKQDAKDKRVFVAETDGMIVGSVRFWTVAGVQGVGKAMMREIERVTTQAHKLYPCTMLRTARNVHFFLSLGYKAETLLPNHYHHLDLICWNNQATDQASISHSSDRANSVSISARSAGESRQSAGTAFARTCSGVVAPAMTDTTRRPHEEPGDGEFEQRMPAVRGKFDE